MRLRQIEVFYHVYRNTSISAAARELNVSQPSVSKVLRHAEDQLGIKLFLRERGRLVPTSAAHELFRDAEELYGRLRIFNESLVNVAKRRGQHVRLGMLPSLSLSVGPELVSQIRQNDPDLTFELYTLHTDKIMEALLEKRCDMCVGIGEIDDPRIQSRKIGEGSLILVSGDKIAEPGEAVELSILEGQNFIGIKDSGPLGRLASDLIAADGVEPLEVVTVHTYHVALSLVRKRVGLAITDQYSAFSQLSSGLHRHRLQVDERFSVYVLALTDFGCPEVLDEITKQLSSVISHLDGGIASMQSLKA